MNEGVVGWLHGDLHHWAIFCCTVASLGLIGAGFAAVGLRTLLGVLGFLNGSGRQPQVIVVNGPGQYVPPPQRRTWGLGRTYLLFAAIFSGGPMLTLLIMGANHLVLAAAAWVGENWWAPLIAVVALVVVGAFVLLIRRDARSARQERTELAALQKSAPVPAVVSEPAVGWSMPQIEGQWDARQ